MFRILLGVVLVLWGVSYFVGINLWAYFWPALLILLGIRLLTRDQRYREGRRWERVEESDQETIDETIVFWGLNKKILTDNFKGGRLLCVFGGGSFDLREAKIKNGEKVRLEVTCVFGGVELRVPPEWSVENQITELAGGFDNQTAEKGKKTKLEIIGTVVLGGIEVKN